MAATGAFYAAEEIDYQRAPARWEASRPVANPASGLEGDLLDLETSGLEGHEGDQLDQLSGQMSYWNLLRPFG